MHTRVFISFLLVGLFSLLPFAKAWALSSNSKSDADSLRVDAGPDVRICAGQSTQLNASPCTRGYTYRWSPTTGLTNPTSCNPTANPTQTTTYTVTMSDGTNSAQDVVTVTVLPSPAVTTTVRNITCVSQGNIRLEFTAGTPPYTIAQNDVIIAENVRAASYDYSVERPGTYSLTITDGNGCTLTTRVAVQQAPNTLRIRSITLPASVGTGVGRLRIQVTGGTPPYRYTIDGGNSWFSNSTFNVRSGIYDLRVGDAAGCNVRKRNLIIK